MSNRRSHCSRSNHTQKERVVRDGRAGDELQSQHLRGGQKMQGQQRLESESQRPQRPVRKGEITPLWDVMANTITSRRGVNRQPQERTERTAGKLPQ